MANGSEGECATESGGKMNTISKKINYLHESCKKNLNLSSEIRAKLLSTEPKETVGEDAKTPTASGGLNNIIDHLQDLLNYINASNAHLVSVNKEI